MKGLKYALAAVIVVALTNKGLSGDVPTNEVMRVTLDLSDGSRVIGIPAISSIPIRTAFAKMDIPLRQIQQVVIGGDHERVEVETTNGDHLTVVLSLGRVELTTLFGKVSVGIEHIRGVQVRLNGRGDLPAKLKECLVLHFSFDKDESGQIYVDGNKAKTTPVEPVRVTSGEVLIGAGRCWSPADDQFKGVLDDVMIFGRALSASEVQQFYNSQK
jgi:hypothetical protein